MRYAHHVTGILASIVIFIILILSRHLYPQDLKSDIYQLVPLTGELPGWTQEDKVVIAKGDSLFSVINGGAEIFREYGFQQAAFSRFRDAGDHHINFEIYEMSDPFSAYGIYSFKTDSSGEFIGIGAECCFSEYYLIFWNISVRLRNK